MSVPFKPHTVTVFPASQATDPTSKAKGVVTWSDVGSSVSCMVYPMSVTAAYEATGVVVHRPQGLLCEVADGGKFHLHDKVLFNGLTYFVNKPDEAYSMGLAADNAFVILGLSMYANPAQ